MIITSKDRIAFRCHILDKNGNDLTKKYCIISYNTITKSTKIAKSIKKDKYSVIPEIHLNGQPKIIRLVLKNSKLIIQ